MGNYADGIVQVKNLLKMWEVNQMTSKVVAASIKNTFQVYESIRFGITILCDVAFLMIDHPGTKIAVDEFTQNW